MMIDYPSDSLASCNFSIVFQKHTMIVCVKILCLSGAHQDMFFFQFIAVIYWPIATEFGAKVLIIDTVCEVYK